MKVLVTGVTGQLGYDVAKELERRHIEYKGVGSKDMDLTVPSEVEKVVTAYHPDAVIHCAAYTAVDKAEDEYGRAMDVNAKGTLALAKAAKKSVRRCFTFPRTTSLMEKAASHLLQMPLRGL